MRNDITLPRRPWKDAATTFDWLGSLWTTLYDDEATIYGYCKGSSLAAAQTYLNFLEIVNNYSRQDVPIFHRQIWSPILIRRSQRNTGNKIVCGINPPVTVGPQPDDTAYKPRAVYKVGGNVVRGSFVTYPFASDQPIAAGLTRISSTIVSPGSVYVKGTHYYLQGNELVFREDYDPFDDPSFLRREVYYEDIDDVDEEILLWGTDAQIDVENVYNQYGYQIAFKTDSGEYYLDAVNVIWDLRYEAANLTALRRALGALLGVATTGAEDETVEDVSVRDDGTTLVVTDAEVYTIPELETLRESVVTGAVLSAGSFLTETVRHYVKLDPDRFVAANDAPLSQFLLDVPALHLSKGIVGNGVSGGLNVEWKPVEIFYRGDDANGNPRLDFELGGVPTDVDTFWHSIWTRAEADDESLADFFADYLWSSPPYMTEDTAVGEINPMQFFMKNYFKYNVGVVVVDFGALPEYIKSLGVFTSLRRLLPAHALLNTVGKQAVTDDVGFSTSETLDSDPGKVLEDEVLAPNEAGLTYRWIRV